VVLHCAAAVPALKLQQLTALKDDDNKQWMEEGLEALMNDSEIVTESVGPRTDFDQAFNSMEQGPKGESCMPERVVKRPQNCKRFALHYANHHAPGHDLQNDTPWGGIMPKSEKRNYPQGCVKVDKGDGFQIFYVGHPIAGTAHADVAPVCYKENQPSEDYFRSCASKKHLCPTSKTVPYWCEETCEEEQFEVAVEHANSPGWCEGEGGCYTVVFDSKDHCETALNGVDDLLTGCLEEGGAWAPYYADEDDCTTALADLNSILPNEKFPKCARFVGGEGWTPVRETTITEDLIKDVLTALNLIRNA